MPCQYSGNLISVIKSFWKLPGCYLHRKTLNPNHLTSKKHSKTQSIWRTTLTTGESTLNHWICQYEFNPDCIPAWLYQSCRSSRPQKTCLVIFIFQTDVHITKPLPLSETVMDQLHQDTIECNSRDQLHWPKSGHVTGNTGSIQVIRSCKKT